MKALMMANIINTKLRAYFIFQLLTMIWSVNLNNLISNQDIVISNFLYTVKVKMILKLMSIGYYKFQHLTVYNIIQDISAF